MKRITLGLLVVLLMAGCTFTPILPEPSSDAARPSASPTPTPSASAGTPDEDPITASPDPVVEAEDVTCRSLLDAETLDRVDRNADGLQFSEDIAERMADQGSSLVAFLDAGGIVCQIGFPNTDNAYLYAHAPMSDTEQAVLQQRVVADGLVRVADESIGVRYCVTEPTISDDISCFLFRDGDAFYSSAETTLGALVESVG